MQNCARPGPTLRELWPIRSLALFGSRMRHDASPDSDLVSMAALKPYIGERVRAEAVAL